jgi:D-glycero-alpha-D-manno-heptose-7-phosphate kinase
MPLPVFAEEKFRFTYRVTESVDSISEFKHPVVRTTLGLIKNLAPLNISTMANLPGRSGLGSSSSFTVGLLNALNSFTDGENDIEALARSAVEIERNKLGEAGGYQDQYQAAFGGLRSYRFSDGLNGISAIKIEDEDFIQLLSSCLILLPVSGSRNSIEFAKKTQESINDRNQFLKIKELADLAHNTSEYLARNSINPIDKLKKLAESVNIGWHIKNEIAGDYYNKGEVERLIGIGIASGAIAGRLCGAGGSGFILLISNPGGRQRILDLLKPFNAFGVEVSNNGSQVILEEDDEYSDIGVVI